MQLLWSRWYLRSAERQIPTTTTLLYLYPEKSRRSLIVLCDSFKWTGPRYAVAPMSRQVDYAVNESSTHSTFTPWTFQTTKWILGTRTAKFNHFHVQHTLNLLLFTQLRQQSISRRYPNSIAECNAVDFDLIMYSHEQRNWMIAFVLPIQTLTTLLLWIRILSRFHRSGDLLGFDDILVFVGWVFGTGLSAAVLLGMATLFQRIKGLNWLYYRNIPVWIQSPHMGRPFWSLAKGCIGISNHFLLWSISYYS